MLRDHPKMAHFSPFPVVWGEPVQEPWGAAATLPAPAALAGEKKRNEVFMASETRLLLEQPGWT